MLSDCSLIYSPAFVLLRILLHDFVPWTFTPDKSNESFQVLMS